MVVHLDIIIKHQIILVNHVKVMLLYV